MKNILLVNGAKEFAHSKGELNESLVKIANDFLLQNNFNVKVTNVAKGYNITEEVENFLWADCVIHQFPVWWMSHPWIIKKYMDEVFTEGHGKLYAHDGRVLGDDSKKYGSGGLTKNKKYMLSVTWNAPLEAFTDKNQFFEGKNIDEVFLHMHKAHEFLGMKKLPTFMCNDVMKNTDFEKYSTDFKTHLKNNFINI